MYLQMHSIDLVSQLLDCLLGLEYAIMIGWFNYKTFNLVEYEHYEKIYNGDLKIQAIISSLSFETLLHWYPGRLYFPLNFDSLFFLSP